MYCFQVPRLYSTFENQNYFHEKIAAEVQKVFENCLDEILFTDFPFCAITQLFERVVLSKYILGKSALHCQGYYSTLFGV